MGKVGKVLRIPKAWRNGKPEESLAQCVNGGSVFGKHEQLLWGDNQELLSSSSKETMEQMYVEKIMSPLLGPKYIDAGVCFFTYYVSFLNSGDQNGKCIFTPPIVSCCIRLYE